MAKTIQSKKQKGRRLELKVARLIREKLGFKAYRMPLSGSGSIKGDIFCKELPFHFELKNQEKLKIWSWWQQIRDSPNPVLIVSGNFRPILAIMDFEMFLDLVKFFKKIKNYEKSKEFQIKNNPI